MHDSVRVDQTIKCAKETSDCTLQLLYLIDIWKNLETKKNIVNSHLKGELFQKTPQRNSSYIWQTFLNFGDSTKVHQKDK